MNPGEGHPTGKRITDRAGHHWPVTGTWCPECDMPTDPVLACEPHRLCKPTNPDALDRLTGTWWRCGGPVRVLRAAELTREPEPESEDDGLEREEPEP